MCDLRSGLGIIFYTVEQIGFAVFVFLLYWNGECMVYYTLRIILRTMKIKMSVF